MDIRIFESYEELSKVAAEMVKDQLRIKPDTLLCAATGNSPLRAYKMLAETDRDLFRRVRLLMLDEWLGLPEFHEASCFSYLQKNLVEPLAISSDRVITFRSELSHAGAECQNMQEKLKTLGPPDLLLLGVGLNGHLGFNEPGEVLYPRPHVVHLEDITQSHSMISALAKTPEYGITLGMSDLLQSGRILLIINGIHKRDVFKRLLLKEISTNFPASFLWLHKNVTVLADQEAAGDLS